MNLNDIEKQPIKPPRGRKIRSSSMNQNINKQTTVCNLENILNDETLENESEHLNKYNNTYTISISYDNLKIKSDKLTDEESVFLKNRNQVNLINKHNKRKYIFNLSAWKIPWIIFTQSIIQIFIYFYGGQKIFDILVFTPSKQHEIWRFFTYSLLHSNTIHLWLNIIIQTFFSFPLETEQGHLKVCLVYYGGVFAGATGMLMFEPLSLVGSSGGVYSLLLSHLVHITLNFNELSYRYFRIASVLVIICSDVIFIILHCIMKNNSGPKIAIYSHIFGAISGILIGFIIYNGKSSSLNIFIIFKYLSLILYISWILVVIILCLVN